MELHAYNPSTWNTETRRRNELEARALITLITSNLGQENIILKHKDKQIKVSVYNLVSKCFRPQDQCFQGSHLLLETQAQ